MTPNDHSKSTNPILVMGATGYVGGRLVPRLLESGYAVRVLVRSPEKLKSRAWAQHPRLEMMVGDVLKPETLIQAMRGCSAAYYLVHSMNPQSKDYAALDQLAAQNVVTAAASAKLERLIYLGGLGEDVPDLSHHLKSRAQVARILRSGSVSVTVLRAAMIIGSGSASFEILRYLVDRLPVMITPRWVDTPVQPIAIRNVLYYLQGCLDHPETTGQVLDIGGQKTTYRELMEIYAQEAHLSKRWILRVPFLTPRLSSYWIHLVTPVSASIARPLAEGLRNPVICHDDTIRKILPQPLLDNRSAIHLALQRIQEQTLESRWTDAGMMPESLHQDGDAPWSGGTVFRDQRAQHIMAPLAQVWNAVVQIGGDRGWYYGNWLWRLRGAIDRLLGGVGLRRGRRHPQELWVGDVVDFWRVYRLNAPYFLMLFAEMRLPGQAVLQFQLKEISKTETQLTQTVFFLPRGLLGILYWFLVLPLHYFVFRGMLLGIASASGTHST